MRLQVLQASQLMQEPDLATAAVQAAEARVVDLQRQHEGELQVILVCRACYEEVCVRVGQGVCVLGRGYPKAARGRVAGAARVQGLL